MARSPFLLNIHELPRRAGEMKQYHLAITPPEKIGTELIGVTTEIDLDARLESVDQGVLLTATVKAVATGECARCLDPVRIEINQRIQELYRYTSTGRDDEELEEDDELVLDGDEMDLETPIRDAIILNVPINPLCQPECEGLCPECGEKWRALPDDHEHEVVDLRWKGLSELKKSLEERDR